MGASSEFDSITMIGGKVISCKAMAEKIKEFPGWEKIKAMDGYKPSVLGQVADRVKLLRSSCETFGPSTYCFLHFETMEERVAFERWLRKNNFKYEPRYSPGQPAVEFKVSWFKAMNWDE